MAATDASKLSVDAVTKMVTETAKQVLVAGESDAGPFRFELSPEGEWVDVSAPPHDMERISFCHLYPSHKPTSHEHGER